LKKLIAFFSLVVVLCAVLTSPISAATGSIDVLGGYNFFPFTAPTNSNLPAFRQEGSFFFGTRFGFGPTRLPEVFSLHLGAILFGDPKTMFKEADAFFASPEFTNAPYTSASGSDGIIDRTTSKLHAEQATHALFALFEVATFTHGFIFRLGIGPELLMTREYFSSPGAQITENFLTTNIYTNTYLSNNSVYTNINPGSRNYYQQRLSAVNDNVTFLVPVLNLEIGYTFKISKWLSIPISFSLFSNLLDAASRLFWAVRSYSSPFSYGAPPIILTPKIGIQFTF
jgi:hypothetical protein